VDRTDVLTQPGANAPRLIGISLGCPLSPLMGALYLKPMDDAMDDAMAK